MTGGDDGEMREDGRKDEGENGGDNEVDNGGVRRNEEKKGGVKERGRN